MNHSPIHPIARRAITLVELLVVIAVLSILTAVIVPQVRVINKDRNVREATRLVGSVFAKASQRGVTDGAAGVIIRRHPNFLGFADLNRNELADVGEVFTPGQNDVFYAGRQIASMRRVPDYTDDFGQPAQIRDVSTHRDIRMLPGRVIARILQPADHDQTVGKYVVRPGDKIYFDSRPTPFLIERVVQVQEQNTSSGAPPIRYIELLVETWNGIGSRSPLQPPTVGSQLGYRIERAPREVKSSRFELTEGQMIDMRHSGSFVAGLSIDDVNGLRTPLFNRMAFTRRTIEDGGSRFAAEDIRVFFNGQGEIDRIHYGDGVDPDADPVPGPYTETRGTEMWTITAFAPVLLSSESYVTPGALQLLVTEDGLETPAGEDSLSQENSLWVIVNQNGSTNISSNTPTPLAAGNDVQERVNLARGIARRREIATQ